MRGEFWIHAKCVAQLVARSGAPVSVCGAGCEVPVIGCAFPGILVE